MARFVNFTGIVAAAIVLLAVSASAQDGAQPQVSCVNAQNIAFDTTKISGTWFEIARNPAPADVYCTEVDVGVSPLNSSLLLVNSTYSTSSSYLNINETVMGNVSLTELTLPSTVGYNISFYVGSGKYEQTTTYKLLATDYDNYALVCAFTNASDPTTEFGVVLARNRNLTNFNSTQLNIYEEMGFNITTAFLNGSMATITQSEGCWASGAATTLPFLSAMFAMIYMMLQFFN